VVIAGEVRPAHIRGQAAYDPDSLLPRSDATDTKGEMTA